MKKNIFLSLATLLFFVSCKDSNNQVTPVAPVVPVAPSGLVTIGNQVWTPQNLAVSTYRNGDPIPEVQDPNVWAGLTTGAWCYHNNSTAYGAVYGKLYNWYAVNDPRGLAPVGYHIPSDAEWTILTDYLGGLAIAGGPMKETGTAHWFAPNTVATNSSGFAGFPGSCRNANGTFYIVGSDGYWWSATAADSNSARNRVLNYNYGNVVSSNNLKKKGFSVRCLGD